MSHLLNLFVMLRVSVLRLSEKVTIISFINISKIDPRVRNSVC